MQGRIIAHHFGPYLAFAEQKTYILHYPKTNKHETKPTVGDIVEFDPLTEQITAIGNRKNHINRPHLANLDLLFIVSSIIEPEYSLLLNLKFLTFALFHALNPVLILTKSDIKSPSARMDKHVSYLKTSGIPTIAFDTQSRDGLPIIQTYLKHKVVAFAGQTGVGKSSIINAISPSFQRSIGSYSQALGRGKHQTKEVILVPYEEGFIADTPGFSSLDLNILPIEFAIYFPGFKSRFGQCKFSNCLHDQELNCIVKDDVKHGKIPLDVYEVYCTLLKSLPKRKPQ
jgi:ribosome biogenesis GTPase